MQPWLALTALALSVSVVHAEARKLAVIVGVATYKHSNLPNLDYASRDAVELAELLRSSSYDQVALLDSTESNPQRAPTFENITRELKSLLADVGKDDVVLVAMSGHGIENETGENFFCPYDANPLNFERCLSLQKLIQDMQVSGAGAKLLLVDACRDEKKLPRGAKGASGDAISELPRGVAAMFSCAGGQKSYESKEAGGGHGIFFYTVLEGLRGEAASPNGTVTWDRLVVHVKENVPTRVSEWIGPSFLQEPHEVKNLVATPILARVSIPSSTPGRPTANSLSRPKSITSQTTGAKLVLIPAGEFMMGSPDSGKDAESDEKPQHRVVINKSFYLGETEVTQGEWKKVMGTEPWKGKVFIREGDDCPASYVSWDDAVEYCKRLSEQDGREYRLPTEAEWEYACRAGSNSKWSFGDSEDALGQYAWYASNTSAIDQAYAHPVRQKKSNRFGLYDMHGNVWEWCSDWYGDEYYGSSPSEDPPGPSTGSRRVSRGGCLNNDPVYARSAIRYGDSPGHRKNDLGFRLASSSSE